MKKSPFPIKLIDSLDFETDSNGQCYSNNYSDIYFQPGIGLEEKKHVFLAGNDLPANWQNKESFVIAETGFGTGLNFLMTFQAWISQKGNCKRLDYISCELHPLNKTQLSLALSCFPELNELTEQLILLYPQELLYGVHRIEFPSANIVLTLVFGDAETSFRQLKFTANAWYLDGFGPSKNPEMWKLELFQTIANKSQIETTASTFTVARKIRDGLSQAGFKIYKSRGFGQKREMLKACYQNERPKTVTKQPWACLYKATRKRNITIIGAGVAGITLAQKLIDKGENISLIDRQESPCLEASGNPQAMVMPMFTINDSKESRFYLRAFQYACQHYSNLDFHQVGVLQLATDDKQRKWQNNLLNKFNLPKTLIQKHAKGLLYPNAGWLDTKSYADNQFKQIDHYLQAEIDRIEFTDNQWQIYSKQKLVHKTDLLILANGIDCLNLLDQYQLPITPKHGQISYFKSDSKFELCQHTQVLLAEGYITPNWNGVQTIGATFDHLKKQNWFEPASNTYNHWQRNTELWANTEYSKDLNKLKALESRAGIRVTTPDHLPICGALINQQQFKLDYKDIHHGRHWQQYPIPEPIKNLYLFTGLGSRGFTSAPILAEYLANQILSHPIIFEQSMIESVHPNRFLYKALMKNHLN